MPTVRPIAGSFIRRLRPGGFTLTELVVAVAIMAVLIAMSVPYFGRALEQARATSRQLISAQFGPRSGCTGWKTTPIRTC